MASPAAAAPPEKAKGHGGSAETAPANDNAGTNEKAANNPHQPKPAKEAAPSGGSGGSSEPAKSEPAKKQPATSAPAKSTTSKSAGNGNAGCKQTPYGSGGSGANTGGVYDDTCDGAASGNGSGGGGANGKPCAGCVGKADEKNPPGQQPGPRDRNNGYECDGNQGIAKTNPAHTGCATSTPPPCVPTQEDPCDPPCLPTEEDPCTTPVPECVPSADKPCAKVLDRTLTRDPGSTPPGSPGSPGTKVLGAVFDRGGQLAFTGFGVAPAMFGGLLLGMGALLVALSRRRQTA